MSILDAVGELLSGWRPLSLSLPPESKTEKKMLVIVTAPPRPPRPPVDLEYLHAKLVTAYTDGDWNKIEPVEWRYVSECLSMGESPLVEKDGFVTAYLSRLKQLGSAVMVKRLARYYLTHFSQKKPGLHLIAACLVEHIEECGVWGERHYEHQLFDIDAAPVKLATATMTSKIEPHRLLESLGFTGTLARANILAAAFYVACLQTRKRLEKRNREVADISELRRLASWASQDGQTFLFGEFPKVKMAFADAMLMPWMNLTPTDETREWITTILIGMFKDPRLSRLTWSGVSEDALSVMLRWLTKASLEQFFAVVDAVVSPDKRHMWEARKQFWRSYYDREFMQEAWVVLGNRGIQYARKLKLGFGVFESGSIQDQTQAVLIMRIGTASTPPVLVADWSHNGYCHIWHDDAESAPKLYKTSYGRIDLNTGSAFQKVHRGAWQDDVADHIRRRTGITHKSYVTVQIRNEGAKP
ncbi:MAG: hypothetical protein HQL98_01425 [Magnetococcales bacterium]|nr:hypothetical protein [Magnetococcales bacterium]